MKSLAEKKQVEKGGEHLDLIANRYYVNKIIGEGGTAVVYQVHDISTGRDFALKKLRTRAKSDKQQYAVELFEREFHTLSHLSHPRVVEVYDYGIEDSGPYYTMELLKGGDLRDLSPLAWQRACQLLLDVCSVLSLLHSRRMVHSDLSPRNVRCTEDGLAKVIDFGAMIPMGPCKRMVGTPPSTAPEVVNLQALDGRTDVYSLGATLYYMLTGRHAYPARDFGQLRNRWRSMPLAPSDIVPGIPKALDSLVMSMIHLDATARPVNTAEVMERLSAIANLKLDEQFLVSQAYLTTPTLVGREWAVTRLRRQLIRAHRGRGATFLIQGAPGVGRSRMIDASVLEGKLIGAIVMRADASNAQAGDYGVVRALIEQLLEALPKEALDAVIPRMGVLGHILPELRDKCKVDELTAFTETDQLRPRVQTELQQWLFEISRQRSLLIAVDDIDKIDEPSAAFIAFLSHRVANHSVVITVSTEAEALSPFDGTLKLLAENSKIIQLKALTSEDTDKLLGSVFGQVPNLKTIAHRLQRISQGNPREIMQLAQHLVNKRVVRYQTGGWTLPDSIDTSDLPDTVYQALKSSLELLSTDARQLAEIMALSPDQSYSFKECLILTEHGQASRLTISLSELGAVGILRIDQDLYTISQQGWVSAIRSQSDKTKERAFHLRLAKLFEQRGQEEFRVAKHLIRAGQEERGLNILCAFSERSKILTADDGVAYSKLIQHLPPDFFQTYLDAIKLCKERKRPRFQLFSLQSRLSGLDWLSQTHDRTYIRELVQQLYEDSGLGIYHELDDSMDPSARLGRALELAQERYQAKSEDEKVLDPLLSIRELALAMGPPLSGAIVSCDLQDLEIFPSLQPFLPLAPALEVAEKTVVGLRHRLAGRYEMACQVYREAIERLSQPDRVGLEETRRRYTLFSEMRAVGVMEAIMGLGSTPRLVEKMEQTPTFEVFALEMLSLYYLWQGDSIKAEDYRTRMELLRIQKNPSELYRGSYIGYELIALALTDDLTGVKRLISSIKSMASRFRSWKPVYHYACGEYQRIRGDYSTALGEIEEAVRLIEPGRHLNWANIVSAYLRILFELGRDQEVRKLGQDYLIAAEEARLGFQINYLKMPMALAEARLGEYEAAVTTSQSAVDYFEKMGSTGINLGLAYETRARVSIYMKDRESYSKYASLCAQQFNSNNNPALAAKYEKLEQTAADREHGIFEGATLASDLSENDRQFYMNMLTSKLTSCRGFNERVQLMLDILIEHSCTQEVGFLYTMQKGGPTLSAQRGGIRPPEQMERKVKDYLIAEIDNTRDATVTSVTSSVNLSTNTLWTGSRDEEYCPVLLGHFSENDYIITGLAVLLLDPDKKFNFPIEVVRAISKTLLDSGEVATHVAAY